MALAISVTVVDSSFATPTQYTAASPSFIRNWQTVGFIESGDSTHVNTNNGITAAGFINVQYHSGNQWQTGTLYVTDTGAQILTKINA